jgi:alpha-tubulin suppressor-like RCC1 family protein
MSQQGKFNQKSQKTSETKLTQLSRRNPGNNLTNISALNFNNNNLSYFEHRLEDGLYSSGANSVYTFGSNEMGQLGKEVELSSPYSFVPVLLKDLTAQRITSIAAGDGHTVCVSNEGIVFAWGASACGQLGLDDNQSMPRDAEGYPFQPTPIPVKLMAGVKIKEVACGDAHTLAMTTEGKVFSWGGAGCGQLGHPNINEMPKDADSCPYQPYPRIIETFKSSTMIHIACGKAHSLSIDSGGCLFTWGAGACGQLGVEDIHTLPVDDDGYPYQPVPKLLKSLKGQNIILGVCGDVHTLALNEKGEIFSFGGGSFGQLGLGSIIRMPLDSDRYPYMPIPTKIESLSDVQIINIACGDSHSMAVDIEGRLFAWGAAACGQLGLDMMTSLQKDSEGNPYQPEPCLVSFFENAKVQSVSCGEAHSLVLCEGGLIYSFGGSSCGQLGYPEIKDNKLISKSFNNRINEVSLKYEKPRLITSLLGKNVLKMSCGGVHNILLTENQSSVINSLYLMMKNETITDVEIILEFKSQKIISMKCHKYVLLCKSPFFYKHFTSEKEQILKVNGNFNPVIFKSIVEYIYLDDSSFINHNEYVKNMTYLDFIVENLKLTKLFELKTLQSELETKLKMILNKYNEVLGNVNNSMNLFNKDTNSEITEQYKGLFFLPNGNSLLIMNEDIIDTVMKNSILLNFNSNNNYSVGSINCINSLSVISSYSSHPIPSKILTQKSLQMDNSNHGNYSARGSKLNKLHTLVPNKKEFHDSQIDSDESLIINSGGLNKTVANIGFSAKVLFDSLTSKDEFDIYEILQKNNFIDSDSDISYSGYDFLKYFNNSQTSDILIKIENHVFYANKVNKY